MKLFENVYVYIVEGDLNLGVIIGDDSVLIVDMIVMFVMVQDLIVKICSVIDKLIKYVVLLYYYVVCVFGVFVYFDEGVQYVIVSCGMYEMIVECGEVDMKLEIECFLCLFVGVEMVLGLIWLMFVFECEIMLFFGKFEVKIMYVGLGYMKGDMIVWLLLQKVLFLGDFVEYDVVCYCGDVQFEQWLVMFEVLCVLGVEKFVLGCGFVLLNLVEVNKGFDYMKDFVMMLFVQGCKVVECNFDLKVVMVFMCEVMDLKFGYVFIYEYCLLFDVLCVFDEVSGIVYLCIWIVQCDKDMWVVLQD